MVQEKTKKRAASSSCKVYSLHAYGCIEGFLPLTLRSGFFYKVKMLNKACNRGSWVRVREQGLRPPSLFYFLMNFILREGGPLSISGGGRADKKTCHAVRFRETTSIFAPPCNGVCFHLCNFRKALILSSFFAKTKIRAHLKAKLMI
ncbi:unnamed protein product, partial [Ectocarpus sp. 4 AP-2014]